MRPNPIGSSSRSGVGSRTAGNLCALRNWRSLPSQSTTTTAGYRPPLSLLTPVTRRSTRLPPHLINTCWPSTRFVSALGRGRSRFGGGGGCANLSRSLRSTACRRFRSSGAHLSNSSGPSMIRVARSRTSGATCPIACCAEANPSQQSFVGTAPADAVVLLKPTGRVYRREPVGD
jgi:hypothetical protein